MAIGYFIPETRRLLMTMPGVVAGIVGTIILWVVLAVLIHSLTWRSIQRKNNFQEKSPEITFDEPTEAENPQPTLATQAIDPIQQQLDERRARLQGLVETESMKPRDFEHEIAWLLNTLTRYKAIPVGGAGDGGVDVKVYEGEKLVGVVQCKRYHRGRPLSPNHVRELYAVKAQFNVKTAYLVTTTRFTPQTRAEAERLGIKLIDNDKLEAMRKQAREVNRQRDERKALEGDGI